MEAGIHLGFLAVVHEAQGYQGGLLVTNSWSRPLEFRVTSPVLPLRVHHILYGATLRKHVLADVIGKALLDKTATPVHLLLVDAEELLDLRRQVECPVVWVRAGAPGNAADQSAGLGWELGPAFLTAANLADAEVARQKLAEVGDIDLVEPFGRVREAIAEARKRPAA